jgi:hypothetical protein
LGWALGMLGSFSEGLVFGRVDPHAARRNREGALML